MDVVGYTDVLSAAPGDSVRVMVSCRGPGFRAELIRLIHGDMHPEGPGFKAVPVASDIDGSYPGGEQPLLRGSHLAVPEVAVPSTFGVAVWLWSTTPGRNRQDLIGHTSWRRRGIALTLEEDRSIVRWIGGAKAVATEPGTIQPRQLVDGEAAAVVRSLGELGVNATYAGDGRRRAHSRVHR